MEKGVERENESKSAGHYIGLNLDTGGYAKIAAEQNRLEEQINGLKARFDLSCDAEIAVKPDKVLGLRYGLSPDTVLYVRKRLGIPKLTPKHTLARLHERGDVNLSDPNWAIREITGIQCNAATITAARKMVGLVRDQTGQET